MRRLDWQATALVALAAVLGAGGALAGGGSWVDKDGHTFVLHGNEWSDDADAFDLSELRDGETRAFGPSDRQLVATREGDVVTLEREATDDDRALALTCNVGRDRCLVLTRDHSDRVAIKIEKHRSCIDPTGSEGDCDITIQDFHLGDLDALGDGHGIVIRRALECESGEDCDDIVIHAPGGGGHAMMKRIEIITEGDGDHTPGGMFLHHGGVIALSEDGDAEMHDLGEELLDGETRIFGSGERQVVAVRNGDVIRLTRDATDDHKPLDVECRVDTDVCQVVTFAEDPEKVLIMVQKSRSCVDGEGDCKDIELRLGIGEGPGKIRILEIEDHDGDDEPSSGRVRRVRVRKSEV